MQDPQGGHYLHVPPPPVGPHLRRASSTSAIPTLTTPATSAIYSYQDAGRVVLSPTSSGLPQGVSDHGWFGHPNEDSNYGSNPSWHQHHSPPLPHQPRAPHIPQQRLNPTYQLPASPQGMAGRTDYLPSPSPYSGSPSTPPMVHRSPSMVQDHPAARMHQNTPPTTPSRDSSPVSRHPAARHLRLDLDRQTSPLSGYASAPYSAPPLLSPQVLLTPSREEVNQFFADMGQILGPETMAALSPPPQRRQLGARQPSHQGPATWAPLRYESAPHHAGSGYNNVSGVLLDAEDMALFNDEALSSQHSYPSPQSAPAFQTSFGRSATSRYSHPPHPPSPPSHHYDERAHYPDEMADDMRSSVGYSAGLPGGRPRSEPNSPALGSGSLRRRRGSSMDGFPMPMYYTEPNLPSAQHPPPSPARSEADLKPRAKRPSPAKGKKACKPPQIAFINYSSQDAKVLLSGVAPSGSSKRRREEFDLVERHQKR